MKVIWKFELQHSGAIEMPAGAELLSVREQGEEICLWALVDPEAPKEMRHFAILGTGWPVLGERLRFIGMAHLQGGALVCHVFEVITDKDQSTH